jgi:putative oxidoreductase
MIYTEQDHMKIASLEPHLRSLLRIVAGFMFSLHGFQKLIGVLGGIDGKGGTAEPFTLIWVAGVLESFGGVMITAGALTRPAAFILSGQMAVAYFRAHAPRGIWPTLNGGELAALYCFLFLWFFAAGPGPWSIDRLFGRKN